MTAFQLVYDDSIPVPPEVAAIVGIRHFGDLIHRKIPLSASLGAAANAAGIEDIDHLRNAGDLRRMQSNLAAAPASTRFLYLPANLIARGGIQAFADFLGKLRWLRQNVVSTVAVDGEGWTGVAVVDREMLRRLLEQKSNGTLHRFVGENQGDFKDIGNGAPLIDLADKGTLLEFLTSHFDVRHFNAISFDTYTVRKESADKDKIRREYTYWRLLPDNMKFWMVQPFDLRDDGDKASYAMERLHVPDVALQWVHGAFGVSEFTRFLERIFHFIGQRPERKVAPEVARSIRDQLYRTKVTERLTRLRAHPAFGQLNALLRGAGIAGGHDALEMLEVRYMWLLSRLDRGHKENRQVIGHGDLCFSNILHEKGTGLTRLIDPRGADTEAELWTDPYYDIAKLSHSVLGSYDFINNGLYDVTLGQSLEPRLVLNGVEALAKQQAAFYHCLSEAGFDSRLTRLYEASLFISMAPLHMDVPSKVLAFLLNAKHILDEVEQA